MEYLPLALLALISVLSGRILFRAFLRAFIKYQYGRMLKEDEQERKRGLLAERAYLRGFEVAGDPLEPVSRRPPPPPPPGPVLTGEEVHSVTCQCRGSRMILDDHLWRRCPGPKSTYENVRDHQAQSDLEFYKQKHEHAVKMLEALKVPDHVIAPGVEVEAIYAAGSKEPVAYVRVADGAQVEQMVCPECYLGYDYKVEARHHEPGSVPDQIPADTPKCKHCNGKGRLSVTRF